MGRGYKGLGGAGEGRGRFFNSAGARSGARQYGKVHLTLRPGACPGPPAQTKGSCVAGRTPVAPGVAARARDPRAGSAPGLGKPLERCGGASLTQGAAATVTGRGATARDPGWESKQASQTPPSPGTAHLRAAPRRLRLRRCRRHLRRLAHWPPPVAALPHLRRQAWAAHLDARGCGGRGSEGAAFSHRPGGRR